MISGCQSNVGKDSGADEQLDLITDRMQFQCFTELTDFQTSGDLIQSPVTESGITIAFQTKQRLVAYFIIVISELLQHKKCSHRYPAYLQALSKNRIDRPVWSKTVLGHNDPMLSVVGEGTI